MKAQLARVKIRLARVRQQIQKSGTNSQEVLHQLDRSQALTQKESNTNSERVNIQTLIRKESKLVTIRQVANTYFLFFFAWGGENVITHAQ